MRSSPIIIDPDNLPTVGKRWDQILIGLLIALLLFMPAAFGAVEAWSQLIVVLTAATLSFCLAARILFDRDFRLTTTWLYVPLLLFIAIAVLQLLPLPVGIIRSIAPSNIATKQTLLDQVFDPTQPNTISFYPLATAGLLRVFLIGGAVFFVVASICRRPQFAKALLTAIFIIGCAEAVLALAQIATGTGSVYWHYPFKQGVHTAGTFVNYSNFAQFVNLSLGAGLALLFVRIEEQRRNELQIQGWSSAARSYWEKNAWLCAGIIVCALAVLGSMSRNGAISMIAAAAVTGALLFPRRVGGRRGVIMSLALAVLAVLLVFGFDTVYERLATIHNKESLGLRWEMTTAAFRAGQQYPPLGTGLGTHQFIAPLFENVASSVVAENADNDIAQLFEETGLAGIIIAATFLLGIAAIILRLAFRGRKSLSMAAFGLMFGLIAVAIHSATDFGQRLPANLALSAAFCGLAVAIARSEPRHSGPNRNVSQAERHLPRPIQVALACVAIVGLVSIWAWAIRDAYAAYLGERWWAAAAAIDARIQKKPDLATDDDYLDRIAAAEGAFLNEPHNVNYGYWLSSYRWELLSRTTDPETGQIVITSESIPFVKRIADELAALRVICPTFGPPYALEGQLRLFVLKDRGGAELVRNGVRLAPYDPPTCLVAGELAAREGQIDDAVKLLTRAVELQPDYFDEVLQLYLNELKRPDLAQGLAGEDYRRLYALARSFEKLPGYADQVSKTNYQAEDALRKRIADEKADSSEMATIARIDHSRGNLKQAIELYSQALSHNYQQVEWHMELAHALAENDQVDDAIHEVKIVLRLRPRDSAATKYLEELISRSENISTRSPR